MEELISGGSSVLEASNSSLPIVQQPLIGGAAATVKETTTNESPFMKPTSIPPLPPLPPLQPSLPTTAVLSSSTFSIIDTPPVSILYDHRSWPSPDIVDHLVDVYFTHFQTLSPIADLKGLRASIANKTCDTFLLLAILSVAAR
jgi:hypothetical protein